jgi:peptidoglycan-associated lipoprotein
MKLRSSLIILLVLAVAACSNSRYGNDGTAVDLNAGAGSFGAGSASDPTSIAYFQQTVGDRILFEIDQSTLNATARGTLDQQADFLLRNMEYTALIEGHADEQGTREYNIALGERRASSVRDYLATRGISSTRLRTLSYGKERPLQICSDESCYSQNRRAVTVLGAGGLGS